MSAGQDGLPPGWAETAIDRLLAVLPDGRTLHQGWSPQCEKDPAPSDEHWGVLKTTSIQDGEFRPEHNKHLPRHFAPQPNIEVQEGDLLLTCAGPRARCGVVCLVRATRPRLMLSGKMYRFRVPAGMIEPAFLEAHLRTLESQRLIDGIKTGGSDSGLNLTHERFRPLPIKVAPFDEQKRIIARIEALRARADAAKEALDAIPPHLEKFRQSVLAAAFRGDLTKKWREAHSDAEPASELLKRIRAERRRNWQVANPRKQYVEPDFSNDPDAPTAEVFGPVESMGWAAATLEGLVDPVKGIPYGIVQTGDPVIDGVPTVRCGDIKGFSIDVGNLKRVHPSLHQEYRRTALVGGEVLIAVRGTVGATAVAPAEMAGMNISREVAMIPVLSGISPRYIMYLLASPPGQELVFGHVKGVAQSGINLRDLRRLPIPLPSLEEQDQIVKVVDAAFAVLDGLGQRCDENRRALGTLNQSILAKAFRGELVPQDPNDEPASVLLERIRREREGGGDQGTVKRGRGRPKAAK